MTSHGSCYYFPFDASVFFKPSCQEGIQHLHYIMSCIFQNPNFLILDEPTNDLDIDTLNILEEFLENYSGVLVLVSHDRYLMDKLTDQLFILEGDSKIKIYNGNYTDYRIEKENSVKSKEINKTSTVSSTASSKKNKLSYKEQKELDNIEDEIPKIEYIISELTSKLNSITNDHTELLNISEQIEQKKAYLDEISMRWLELNEIKEGN